ncbi:hypothetical protein FRB97_007187 [Tulasnella sp. 331]|nr:hypothetical protein FRB97_007187 [Tulasnella sp. 331]
MLSRLAVVALTIFRTTAYAAHNISVFANDPSVHITVAQNAWGPAPNCGNNGEYTQAKGSTFTFNFVGTAVYVFGSSNEDGGIINFTLDGGPTYSFDRWAPPPYRCGILWFDEKGLANGSHSLVAQLEDSSPENITATGFLEVQFFYYTVLDESDATSMTVPSDTGISSPSSIGTSMSTSTPTTGSMNGSGTTGNGDHTNSNSGPSAAAVGGGVAGGFILLILLAILFFLCLRRRSQDKERTIVNVSRGQDGSEPAGTKPKLPFLRFFLQRRRNKERSNKQHKQTSDIDWPATTDGVPLMMHRRGMSTHTNTNTDEAVQVSVQSQTSASEVAPATIALAPVPASNAIQHQNGSTSYSLAMKHIVSPWVVGSTQMETPSRRKLQPGASPNSRTSFDTGAMYHPTPTHSGTSHTSTPTPTSPLSRSSSSTSIQQSQHLKPGSQSLAPTTIRMLDSDVDRIAAKVANLLEKSQSGVTADGGSSTLAPPSHHIREKRRLS